MFSWRLWLSIIHMKQKIWDHKFKINQNWNQMQGLPGLPDEETSVHSLISHRCTGHFFSTYPHSKFWSNNITPMYRPKLMLILIANLFQHIIAIFSSISIDPNESVTLTFGHYLLDHHHHHHHLHHHHHFHHLDGQVWASPMALRRVQRTASGNCYWAPTHTPSNSCPTAIDSCATVTAINRCPSEFLRLLIVVLLLLSSYFYCY